jgi:hypothetical protein
MIRVLRTIRTVVLVAIALVVLAAVGLFEVVPLAVELRRRSNA